MAGESFHKIHGPAEPVRERGSSPAVPSNPNSRLGPLPKPDCSRMGSDGRDSSWHRCFTRDRLDVAVRPTGESFVFKRTGVGIEDLIVRLEALSPKMVAIEATGGFEAVVAAGVSQHSVHQLWQKNDLKSHRTKTFKLSNDPRFEEKFWDVIGLFLNPPDKALVLCCDEKSQCQALERSQPGLPLGIGHIRTRTHDYIRHGTITLFAALSYLEGKLISRTEEKHTHVEWLRFLKQIHREAPKELEVRILSPTTMRRTNTLRSKRGLPNTRVSTCTSLPPEVRG